MRAIDKVLAGMEDNHILPFFWQHGEDEATLRKYMHAIHDANIGAVCVESRPHPDFCGPKWWADMDAITDEAKKLGMQVWILDDAHFPTGFANGALKEADSSLCRQSLVVQYVEVPEDQSSVTVDMTQYRTAAPWAMAGFEQYTLDPSTMRTFDDDELVSVTAIKQGGSPEDLVDLTDEASCGTLTFTKPSEGIWKIAILHLTRNRGPHRDYINMMDMASCHKLIEAVYEPHFEHYGDLFGTTIAGFFSDEPEIGNGHLYQFEKKIGELDDQCWSKAVGTRLREAWGEDYRRFLPLIWFQDFDRDLQARVRVDYMNAVTREVEKDFSFQVGDWCRAHGVKYIGHLIEDNHQDTRTGSSLGHYFRGLAGQDWAGIDDIGGQILPQGEAIGPGDFMNPVRDGEFWHYTLGKLGGSLAAIDPLKKGDAMCEIFGNYGWSEGVRLEKYLADHLMVRGINNYVPHAFTAKDFPDPDCPPHFYAHGHNPQYRHFGYIMKYMNRVCTLISGGKAVIPAAILYHAEADWAGETMMLQKPAIELYDRQIDYHFIPADVFTDEKYGTEISDVLTVNGQAYRALIVPEMEYIPSCAADAILAFAAEGGKVYFVNAAPKATVEGGSADSRVAELAGMPVVPLEALGERLKADGVGDVVISPADTRIRIYHYRNDSDLYMIVNEGTETWKGTVTLDGRAARLYDAWENEILPASAADAGDGKLAIALAVEPLKSIFVVTGDAEALPEVTAKPACTWTETDWSKDWERSIVKSIAYPAFEGAKTVDLPDALEKEEPTFSGFVRYDKTLVCGENPVRTAIRISDAYEGVEVFVNGESLGIQVAPPFEFELTERLKAGENLIRIEVATTLEREAVGFPSRWKSMGMEPPAPTVPSGINGCVTLLNE